ncbi:hypothetical protein [Sphingomonas hankookensis]|uniref:hypothetical protein n=1 Tax=Sphingomonas hankookensis TaxID=563996 RepID=UPI003D303540
MCDHQPDRDAWFAYSRHAGKVSAYPVSIKGWLALIGCILLTLLVGWAISGWANAVHPIFGYFALAAVIVAGVLLTIWLSIAKGTAV